MLSSNSITVKVRLGASWGSQLQFGLVGHGAQVKGRGRTQLLIADPAGEITALPQTP